MGLHDITNVGRALGKPGKIPSMQPAIVAQATSSSLRSASALRPASEQLAVAPATVPVQQHNEEPLDISERTREDEPANPQLVSEYANEIFNKLFRDEATHIPRANYMESQSDINPKMRAILIDWLVEVHMKYKLRPETLFLTVNLIDRYLTRMPVMRKRLQLVGVVAMFIAAKFEEIHPPEVADFVYITDSAYTKEDILTMECQMLTTINFQVVVPTASHFMDRLQNINRCDVAHREVAQYLVELALLHLPMIRHTPSRIVSAALLLSNELMGRASAWPPVMEQHSRHTEQQLRECANEFRVLLENAPGHWLQAVQKKYSLPQHQSVARMAFTQLRSLES